MRVCYMCNKDLENAETYYFDCEKYTCNNCYELYHKPKYNEIQRNELINHYQKLQTQKAIECLNEIFNIFEPYEDDNGNVILEKNGISFIEYFFDKIKELEGEKE